MATERQKKLVKNLTENYSTKKELLQESGYSVSSSIQPSRIIESKGIKELIAKSEDRGLTDELCIDAIIRAIKGKDLNTAVNAVKFWYGVKYPASKQNESNTVLIPILGGATRDPIIIDQDKQND